MTEFNLQQQGACRPARGIHIVIAGPGTGKTRTMIERINNTVKEYAVRPENLLILTFSRKAAEEIRERLTASSGKDYDTAFAGTFHSFCLRILKENSGLYLSNTGMRSFPDIIDSELEESIRQQLFMQEPGRFMGIPYDAIIKIMNRRSPFPARTAVRLSRSGLFTEIEKFREQYRQYKLRHALIDYDDMMLHASELLAGNTEVRKKLHAKYRFIFIDEFQDTSREDFNLLTNIAGKDANIFMVGDDYQAIYRFRGARVEYLVNSDKFFPGANIHKLTINYRSHSEIVALSNRFIRHNSFRSKKKIISAKGKGAAIMFHRAESSASETDTIARILAETDKNGTCAILCRNNYQVKRLQRSLSPCRTNLLCMTMHASKGLEFDCVIIAGVSDGIIPDRDTDIEDERRLFYVALTRARSRLHIIYETDDKGNPPRFISECGYSGR
jgi:DNA helicase-2/ATP-dependent DNA helicase PcrA